MIAKFRDRWERLKESAKRKKSAKMAENADLSVRERIDEDPEAEAAAAAQGLEDEEDPITMFSDDEEWPARGGRTRVWVERGRLVFNPIRGVRR